MSKLSTRRNTSPSMIMKRRSALYSGATRAILAGPQPKGRRSRGTCKIRITHSRNQKHRLPDGRGSVTLFPSREREEASGFVEFCKYLALACRAKTVCIRSTSARSGSVRLCPRRRWDSIPTLCYTAMLEQPPAAGRSTKSEITCSFLSAGVSPGAFLVARLVPWRWLPGRGRCYKHNPLLCL
jgi:hypothetical protein